MADDLCGTREVFRRSPGTVCYVAALDHTLRTPSPEPFIEDSDDEDNYDPAFLLLLEESESLEDTFQKQSLEYGLLKYELRRAAAYYNHGNIGYNPSLVLINNELLEIGQDILYLARAKLSDEQLRQSRFFTSRVGQAKATLKHLELLKEDNNSVLDKLRVLHYPIEETRHINRRDKLVQSQTNLDFLIEELCDEILILLSSRLVAYFSE